MRKTINIGPAGSPGEFACDAKTCACEWSGDQSKMNEEASWGYAPNGLWLGGNWHVCSTCAVNAMLGSWVELRDGNQLQPTADGRSLKIGNLNVDDVDVAAQIERLERELVGYGSFGGISLADRVAELEMKIEVQGKKIEDQEDQLARIDHAETREAALGTAAALQKLREVL